jgi:hypothetical protein
MAISVLKKARSRREPNLGCIVVMKMPVTTCPELLPFSSYCIPQPAKDFDVVVLSYCLAWRSVLMENNTFMI